MVRALRFLSLAAVALACGPAAAAETPAGGVVQRIVVFKPQTPPAARIAIASQSGAAVLRELLLIDAVAVRVAPAALRSAEANLKARGEVLRVIDDPRVNWLESQAATLAEAPFPAVSEFLRGWSKASLGAGEEPPQAAGQEIPWGIARVQAPAAWAATKGKGVKVAVIDTGIDFEHPDLKANVAGGWSAVDKENPQNFKDDNGHGTHVSGTIAARDDDGGVVGLAPEATLYGVKVLDAQGSGNFSDVIAGMDWAVAHQMQVVNMSLGAGKGNEALQAAVEAMAKAGVILLAAAGNSGGAVGYPAAYPQAIAIAAMDAQDKVAYFSSRGPQVAFIAPGVAVKSTTMGGGYGKMSGTSMACPHAAGLAALAVAAKGYGDPEALRAAFKAAATPLPSVPAEEQGAGVVDAGKLVK